MQEISLAKLFDREMPQTSVEQTNHEHIQSSIEWDDENEGELPKIRTGDKELKRLELGRELMTFEGFRITITIEDSKS